ncbi:VCBS repeat protein [Maribacter vaceletii]|uniref:VCBS repeat protein n=1 Tax=Maribacter vaceletii TaxID=1206816 RepID=A0A495ECV1_9FLAO|nr:VCBS repeat-containing protein [Maribacter vaceletii]RKR14383.1 VCBS repeat protein [Maribacter vaceletii]
MNFYNLLFKLRLIYLFIVLLTIANSSCKKAKKIVKKETAKKIKVFEAVPSNKSGIAFTNTLEETLESNYYQYLYTYIGGGVAAGDINDDGYVDLYFTSNSSEDKLYLNQGGLFFKDITEEAGITFNDGFNTGVTMADVNQDGFLDIYVSRGGWKDEDNKFANLLYINNGDLTFTESAKKHGLDDTNRTIQTTFFDFDNDNDLDAYISNSPDISGRAQITNLEKIHTDPKTLNLKGSDRLYENDGSGNFKDISKKAGLLNDIGFGLNPIIGDLNNDGFQDIYVCNDFNYPDLAYINNGNGTFTESSDKLVKHMSFNSMGSDLADINNDGFLDLMTLDMNPEDYVRSKTTMGMTSISSFEDMVKKGYHYQYMHNMLQLNNGNGTFSEISKMAGIANTDWSWSLLSADFDLDGYNDIYITNGVYRDVIDRDKNNEILEILRANKRKPTKEDFLKFAKMLPQQKLSNYIFKNNGDRTFTDATEDWSNTKPTFSNGATYADFDNDGDLDIVVNNINEEVTFLRNTTIEQKRIYFLKIDLAGPEKNFFGVDTKVNLHFKDGSIQTRQVTNSRGFLSSTPTTLHFGINKNMSVQKLEVIWPDGKTQILNDVKANQSLLLNYAFATEKEEKEETKKTIFNLVKTKINHKDPYFNDYDLQVLLPHKLSQTGPSIAKTDLNKDGYDDIFIGGGKGQPSQLFFGRPNSKFTKKNIPDFDKDKGFEDQSAVFFDADNDGDQDLYVVSGSYEFFRSPTLLQDRLYINTGNGNFKRELNSLPQIQSSGSIVSASDYDKDGDIDLFIGGRVVPGEYPYAPNSYLLVNENGKFTNQIKEISPELEKIGMVTSAQWVDINKDNKLDLVVTGEWMGIEIFINKNNKLIKSKEYSTLHKSVGWWNKIVVEDIDNDGDKDIIAGNLGLNYKFHASTEKPFHIYTTDFDFNGTEDIVLAKNYNGREVPVRGKGCMTQQLPHLARKIPSYTDFANKDVKDIVGNRIESALHYQATEFKSGIFINNGSNGFSFEPFTNEVQQSPINSIAYQDFDKDGLKDLLLAGNNYMSEVETTRSDAGVGTYLKGTTNGDFKYIDNAESGFYANKDVRSIIVLNNETLMIINNNDYHEMYRIKK